MAALLLLELVLLLVAVLVVLREKGTGPFCAKHPSGRSGKRGLSPFPVSVLGLADDASWYETGWTGDGAGCAADMAPLCPDSPLRFMAPRS